MPSIKINQFSKGWCPSDDQLNGRKDCLLQMDNLELDENGAVSMVGGFSQIGSTYANPATDIFSNILSGVRVDYVADNLGNVFKQGSLYFAGGSTVKTAFSTAYEYTLICSGTVTVKDAAAATYNLGIGQPTVAPAIGQTAFFTGSIGGTWSIIATVGTASNTGIGGGILSMTTAASGTMFECNAQTTALTPAAVDFWNMTVAGSALTTIGVDTDLFLLTIQSAVLGNLAKIFTVNLYFLTDAGDGSGDNVINYYQLYQLTPGDITQGYSSSGGFVAEQCNLIFRRADFTRVGPSTDYWNTIRGFRVDIVSTSIITVTVSTKFMHFQGGAAATEINGTVAGFGISDVNYLQVNVRNDSSYTGLSIAGPIATFVQTNQAYVAQITPQVPTDPQVNAIWIFRQDAALNLYYRVMTFTPANWSTPQVDGMSDQDALALDITYNPNLISTNSIAPILAICGIFEGRWFYFTDGFLYPSDINDPDLVDPSLAIKTTGVASEIFLWAKVINDNGILVGTSRDVYSLTGTFTTLADGTVDLYYRPLSTPYPPISYDADVYNGVVYYMAKDGWRSISPASFYGGQTNNLIVSPNTDVLYEGSIRYGYSGPDLLNIIPGSTRFPILIARNKLFCSITGQKRLEVYDFVRQYWKVIQYGFGDVQALTYAQDGTIEAVFSAPVLGLSLTSLNAIDLRPTPLGSLNLLTPIFDNGTLRQRKDSYTIRLRFYTGNTGNVTINLMTDLGTFTIPNISSPVMADIVEDISELLGANIPKWFQVNIVGVCADFLLEDIEIFFDERPIPLTFKRTYKQNFGSTGRKRLRVWPINIDTLTAPIQVQLLGDNSVLDTRQIQTTEKTTYNLLYDIQTYAIDYELKIGGRNNNLFEYWGSEQPDIEALPVQRLTYKTYNTNFGSTNPKRLRVWPLVINTLGNVVAATLYVDDAFYKVFLINTRDKDTYEIQCPDDVLGVDFEVQLEGGPFEFYEFLAPKLVQNYPNGYIFYQVGPQELNRYGRIDRLMLRVIPTSNSIPYTIYMSDNNIMTGKILVVAGKEDTYQWDVNKGISGAILRIELGGGATPIFYPYYLRARCKLSGTDTDGTWVPLGPAVTGD